MNKKKFIEIIHDQGDRAYPLHYKDVKMRKNRIGKFQQNIFVEMFQSKCCESFCYYKPISKIL